MGLFNKQRTDGRTYDGQGEERRGSIDVIQYNGEADEIVWKFPYNNISMGAQLIVNQSQEAVFLSGGAIADIFGPGTKTLSANNIPILQKLINLPFGGKTPFVAEVWYVSKTIRRNLTFGTSSPIPLRDPLYQITIPVRSHGKFGVQIEDSSSFLTQMVGTSHLTTTEDIIDQFVAVVVRQLKDCIGKYIIQKKISIVELGANLNEISNYVKNAISEEFAQYGLRITNFDVEDISFDENNPNVKKILDSESERAKRLMEGYSYQQERQLDVMESAAQNEGGAGQMMGAGMGLGMGLGVGSAFGQQMGNISGVMNPQATQAPPVPPPPPVEIAFYVMINNVQQGPYDMQTLRQLIQNGQLTRDSYVWKAGMSQWIKANSCTEFQPLFSAVPPPPPIV